MARAGRTQRIAVDETPLNTAVPDLGARLGWLLAMSRLHHPDAAFQDGGHFAQRLADGEFPASRSLVSRWESGQIPVPHEGAEAYERVLGLAPGRLSSVLGYLRLGATHGRERLRRLDPASDSFVRRLDQLVEAAVTGTADTAGWQELGRHLTSVPAAYLQPQTRQALARRLVGALPRATDIAYRQLSVAAFTLSSVRQLRDPLVAAIADYLAHPAVQVVNNPLVLLDQLPTRESARLVLDSLEHPDDLRTYRMGVWLARQKAVRNEFTDAEQTKLHMIVLRSWRSDAAQASEYLAELIADLPEGIRSTLVEAATKAGRPKLGYVVQHGEDVVASRAAAWAQELADEARAVTPQRPAYTTDVMLPRLVREALFHVDTERSHWAALVLSASPFARPLGDVVLHRLADGRDPAGMRRRLATLLRYVCDDTHRLRMMALARDPAEQVAVPLLHGLGHLSYSVSSDQHLRGSLELRWSPRERAKLYALGMTGSPLLDGLRRSTTAPAWQREAAQWWRDLGPAVRS